MMWGVGGSSGAVACIPLSRLMRPRAAALALPCASIGGLALPVLSGALRHWGVCAVIWRSRSRCPLFVAALRDCGMCAVIWRSRSRCPLFSGALRHWGVCAVIWRSRAAGPISLRLFGTGDAPSTWWCRARHWALRLYCRSRCCSSERWVRLYRFSCFRRCSASANLVSPLPVAVVGDLSTSSMLWSSSSKPSRSCSACHVAGAGPLPLEDLTPNPLPLNAEIFPNEPTAGCCRAVAPAPPPRPRPP